MLKKSLRIFLPVLVILMGILLVILFIPRNGFKARAQEIERNFMDVQAFIEKLEPDPVLWSNITVCEEEAQKMFTIGIGGVPLLVNEMDKTVAETNSYNMYCAFYMFGIQVLLCLDEDSFELPNIEGFANSKLKEFFRQANEKIPEILQMDKSVDEKMNELSRYGVLSILYLIDEKGDIPKEYEPYLTKIGLQYTPMERAYPSDSVSNDQRKFDAGEWLSDNKYDLQILSEYVNGLTV